MQTISSPVTHQVLIPRAELPAGWEGQLRRVAADYTIQVNGTRWKVCLQPGSAVSIHPAPSVEELVAVGTRSNGKRLISPRSAAAMIESLRASGAAVFALPALPRSHRAAMPMTDRPATDRSAGRSRATAAPDAAQFAAAPSAAVAADRRARHTGRSPIRPAGLLRRVAGLLLGAIGFRS